MSGRIVTGAIIVFWLAMMGWLVKREILPNVAQAREFARTPTYRQVEKRAETPRTDKMGIYLGKRRIGQSVTTISKEDDATRIQNRTEARLDIGAGIPFLSKFSGLDLRLKSVGRIHEERLLDFTLVVALGEGEPFATVDGRAVGDELVLRVRQGNSVTTQTVPYGARQAVSTDLTPAFTPEQLRVGETWTMRSMDLQTMKVRESQARVLRREQVKVSGQMRDAFVIEIPYGSRPGEVFTVWAAPDGEVLVQQFFGFRFEREEADQEKDKVNND